MSLSWPAVLREVVGLPRVTVQLADDDVGRRLHAFFTRRHRLKLIRNKTLGVELLELPYTMSDYERGSERQAFRTNRRRAMTLGYQYEVTDAAAQVDDLLRIHLSLPERQGRQMLTAYTKRSDVEAYLQDRQHTSVVRDAEGSIQAYATVDVSGDLACISQIMGHGEHLRAGVMYLLLDGVIRGLLDDQPSSPRWLMYDMYFGAEPGLRYFKERLGFRPYRVRWRISEISARLT
jgi:hypothetical protein